MKVKISVIVPVYNVENYLERCLRSVTGQTYHDIEIILVNDGSTDRCGEICEEWKARDERIIVIHQENKGLGEARNIGIRRAHGEYVAFIDSDDWWEEDALKTLMQSAEKYDSDIVCMNFFFSEVDADGNLQERPFVQYYLIEGVTNAQKDSDLLFTTDERIWSKIYRRELFVLNDLYMPHHPFEDFPITPVLMMKAERISQVNRCLYHYFHKRKGNLVGDIRNYCWIPKGMEELRNNLIRFGFMEPYGNQFKRYSFSFFKRIMESPDTNKLTEEEYIEFCNPFWEGMKEFCPEVLSLQEKTVFLLGSESGRAISRECFFRKQIIGSETFPKRDGEDFSFEKLEKVDYILVDFLNMSIKEFADSDFLDDIEMLVKKLKEYNLSEKIVLMKLFLSEKYGIHKKKLKKFEGFQDIRKQNIVLERQYSFFENLIGKPLKMVGFKELNNYTYLHTINGCKPQYYNRRFHEKAAEKIAIELQHI